MLYDVPQQETCFPVKYEFRNKKIKEYLTDLQKMVMKSSAIKKVPTVVMKEIKMAGSSWLEK